MAINTLTFEILKQLNTKQKICLCLGYPDMCVNPQLFKHTHEYNEVSNADKIKKKHGWDGPIYNSTDIFTKELGFKEVEYADIEKHEGSETIFDLNFFINWKRKYDFIIDAGTAEHCFNLGQVFDNIRRGVNLNGGIIMHINPLNLLNHGFWNINPTAYFDFYNANGFEIIKSIGMNKNSNNPKFFYYSDNNKYRRFNFKEGEVLNLIVAKSISDTSAKTVWPVQHKYKTIIKHK